MREWDNTREGRFPRPAQVIKSTRAVFVAGELGTREDEEELALQLCRDLGETRLQTRDCSRMRYAKGVQRGYAIQWYRIMQNTRSWSNTRLTGNVT